MLPLSVGSRLGVAFFGTMIGTTAGLGTWQLYRYGWKQELIATRKRDLGRPCLDATDIPIEDLLSSAVGDHVSRVSIRGTLDLSRQVVIRPRPPPKGIAENLVPATGNDGALLVAPLQRPNGDWILVIRGWWPNASIARVEASPVDAASQLLSAPKNEKNLDGSGSGSSTPAVLSQTTPSFFDAITLFSSASSSSAVASSSSKDEKAASQKSVKIAEQKATTTVEGILRPPEDPGYFKASHNAHLNEFTWLDTESISAQLGISNQRIEAGGGGQKKHEGGSAAAPQDGKNGGRGLPVAVPLLEMLVPQPTKAGIYPLSRSVESYSETHIMPFMHLVYAATWLSLAAFGTVIAVSRFRGAGSGGALFSFLKRAPRRGSASFTPAQKR